MSPWRVWAILAQFALVVVFVAGQKTFYINVPIGSAVAGPALANWDRFAPGLRNRPFCSCAFRRPQNITWRLSSPPGTVINVEFTAASLFDEDEGTSR